MIGKKVFLEAIDKLNTVFPERPLTPEQAQIYYDTLSPDFTDVDFIKQLNHVLKNSFKFPPIAAFYKDHVESTAPLTTEEAAQIKKTMESYENGL